MNDTNRALIDDVKAIAEMNRDMVERWEEYQRTGKHISAERADAWLARLEAGELAPPPEPAGSWRANAPHVS